MRFDRRVAAAVTAVALAIPGLALASQPTNPGQGNGPPSTAPGQSGTTGATGTSGPQGPSSHAKAYGKLCQGESKKHVAGTPGTPFSKCVTDMAKAAHGASPKAACKNESKKHVKGEKGTPFSRCVSAAAKLKHQQQS
jgi:hypothetical protein